jgi:CHAT domain-containing protein
LQKIKLLFLTIMLLQSYGTTRPRGLAITSIGYISQQTSPDVARSSAQAVFDEAMQLYQQRTVESLKQAIPRFQEASQLFEVEGDRRQQAHALSTIARVYADLGEKQKALEYFEQALALSQFINDSSAVADNLNRVGGVYASLNQHEKALEYLNRALLLSQSVGDRAVEARTLRLLGHAYNALEQHQKALEYLNRALLLSQTVGDRAVEARILASLAWTTHILGDSQRALEELNQSLLLSRAVGDRAEEARTLINMGKVYHDLGDNQKALDALNRALQLSGSVGNRAQRARTLANIAKVLQDQGQLTEALDSIQAATKIFDNLYFAIDDRDLKTQYFTRIRYYHQLQIDLLMQLHRQSPTQGYDRLAFETGENARARSLIQLLSESNIDLKPKKNSPLVIQEQQILKSRSLLERQRSQLLDSSNSPVQAKEIDQRIDLLIQQHKALMTRLRSENPAYTSLKYPQSLTLEQIQQQILDSNTMLLEYSLGQTRSYLWAVTKTDFFSYELPARAEINAAVNDYLKILTNPSLAERPQSVIQASIPLSQMLLNPVESELGQKRLLIVSDEALQYLPFATLALPSQMAGTTHAMQANSFLLAKHEIVNIPSVSTLAILRDQKKQSQPAAKSIAIFADPVFSQNDERLPKPPGNDSNQKTAPELNALPTTLQTLRSSPQLARLPETRREAEQILNLFPNKRNRFQVFDFNANKVNATRPDLNQYRIIHFATHGIFDSLHPELSRIILSTLNRQGVYQDASLTLYDIFNLNLSADLVVLSACQSGLGQNIRGEGLVGLTRGFMYAGTPRVLASLWNVNDESTAILMTDFYKAMLEQNLSPAAALRAAQIRMLQNPQWQSPYYWAAFTLQGEW